VICEFRTYTLKPRSLAELEKRPAEAYVAMLRALIPSQGRWLGSETWRSSGLRLETEASREAGGG